MMNYNKDNTITKLTLDFISENLTKLKENNKHSTSHTMNRRRDDCVVNFKTTVNNNVTTNRKKSHCNCCTCINNGNTQSYYRNTNPVYNKRKRFHYKKVEPKRKPFNRDYKNANSSLREEYNKYVETSQYYEMEDYNDWESNFYSNQPFPRDKEKVYRGYDRSFGRSDTHPRHRSKDSHEQDGGFYRDESQINVQVPRKHLRDEECKYVYMMKKASKRSRVLKTPARYLPKRRRDYENSVSYCDDIDSSESSPEEEPHLVQTSEAFKKIQEKLNRIDQRLNEIKEKKRLLKMENMQIESTDQIHLIKHVVKNEIVTISDDEREIKKEPQEEPSLDFLNDINIEQIRRDLQSPIKLVSKAVQIDFASQHTEDLDGVKTPILSEHKKLVQTNEVNNNGNQNVADVNKMTSHKDPIQNDEEMQGVPHIDDVKIQNKDKKKSTVCKQLKPAGTLKKNKEIPLEENKKKDRYSEKQKNKKMDNDSNNNHKAKMKERYARRKTDNDKKIKNRKGKAKETEKVKEKFGVVKVKNTKRDSESNKRKDHKEKINLSQELRINETKNVAVEKIDKEKKKLKEKEKQKIKEIKLYNDVKHGGKCEKTIDTSNTEKKRCKLKSTPKEASNYKGVCEKAPANIVSTESHTKVVYSLQEYLKKVTKEMPTNINNCEEENKKEYKEAKEKHSIPEINKSKSTTESKDMIKKGTGVITEVNIVFRDPRLMKMFHSTGMPEETVPSKDQIVSDQTNNRYILSKHLHKGHFSDIMRGFDTANHYQTVIIKLIKSDINISQKFVSIIRTLSTNATNNNCIKALDIVTNTMNTCIVMENYLTNMESLLAMRLTGFEINQVISYTKQILFALKHLRNLGVVHSDIRPGNLLMDETLNNIKLSGFETSFYMTDTLTEHSKLKLCRKQFRSPESILGCYVDYSTDIWSTACTIYNMITNKLLIKGKTTNEILYNTMSLVGPIPTEVINRGKYKYIYFNHNDLSFMYRTSNGNVVLMKDIKNKVFIHDEIRKYYNSVRDRLTVQECSVRSQQAVDLLNYMLIPNNKDRCSVYSALLNPFLHEI